MRQTLLLTFFLLNLFQLKSQKSDVEVYLMESNTIVKGKIETNTSDSIRIRVDSLNTIVFAKSELEGKELKVSKTVRKLRFKLLFNEFNFSQSLPVGLYQTEHGDKTKGKIMTILTKAGKTGIIISGCFVVIVLPTVKEWISLMTVVLVGASGAILSTNFLIGTKIWCDVDIFIHLHKIVYGRYYYTKHQTK